MSGRAGLLGHKDTTDGVGKGDVSPTLTRACSVLGRDQLEMVVVVPVGRTSIAVVAQKKAGCVEVDQKNTQFWTCRGSPWGVDRARLKVVDGCGGDCAALIDKAHCAHFF